jgi:hypothetical protein
VREPWRILHHGADGRYIAHVDAETLLKAV